jgi:hypothetical protein
VGKHVQPRQWFVVYGGNVRAPKTARFRFVGARDDVLTVRFNNRLVFDYGYTMAATGGTCRLISAENYQNERNSDAIRNFKRLSPMPVPSENFRYSTNGRINHDIGGLAAGPEFQVTAGMTYPIEILISEIPSGVFFQPHSSFKNTESSIKRMRPACRSSPCCASINRCPARNRRARPHPSTRTDPLGTSFQAARKGRSEGGQSSGIPG